MDKFRIDFELKYISLIVGLVLTISGVFIYLYLDSTFPWIKEVMAIVAGGLALTGLLYSAMNLHSTLKINEQKFVNEKKAFSALLMSEWHKPEMTKLTIIGAKFRVDLKNVQPKEIITFLEANPEAHNAMVSMLNFFEKMAICIENEVADEKLLRDFFRGIVRGYYNTLVGLIEHKRVDLGDRKVCMYFEKLAQKWA